MHLNSRKEQLPHGRTVAAPALRGTVEVLGLKHLDSHP